MTCSALMAAAVLIIIPTHVASEKVAKFSKIECLHNDKYLSNMTCGLTVPRRNVVESNIYMVLKEHVSNARVHSELYKFDERFKSFVINITFNICDIIKLKGIQKILVQSVLKSMEKNSNMVQCGHEVRNHLSLSFEHLKSFCYFQPGEYYWVKFKFNSEYFTFLDVGRYKLVNRYYDKKEYIGSVNFYGDIYTKYAKRGVPKHMTVETE